jgi:hypothetical protein
VRASASVEGTITSIDLTASTVTLQTRSGTSVTVSVSQTTIVDRNELHTTLAAFLVGDPVEAKFDAQGNTLKIEAGLDGDEDEGDGQGRVEGVISAINLNDSTVTIQTRSGSTVVVRVSPTTKIERNDQHTTLAAFQIGDRGEARFDIQGNTLKIEAVGL